MTMITAVDTPAPAGPSAPAGSSAPADGEAIHLYQAVGGRGALVAAVDGLFGRLLADPELAPFFPGGVGDRHRRYVVTLLAEALGGPHRYRGPDLAESHRGLGITGGQFGRTAAHLAATLDELGVPADLAGQPGTESVRRPRQRPCDLLSRFSWHAASPSRFRPYLNRGDGKHVRTPERAKFHAARGALHPRGDRGVHHGRGMNHRAA
jgi:hemoglobin